MSTFAEQMVAKYEALLLANAGLKFVEIDGTRTAFEDLTAQYEHWKAKANREGGTGKPRLSVVDMGGASSCS